MKIRAIKAYEVRVPARVGAVDSPAIALADPMAGWPDATIVLLEVLFNDGVVGLGECGRGEPLTGFTDALRALPGRQVTGLDIAPLVSRVAPLDGETFPGPWWRATDTLGLALETAALDAMGKRLGCRAVDVLGGAYREHVPVDAWCGRQSPEDLREVARRAVEAGFVGLKIKSHPDDPISAQLAAIAEVVSPGFRLTVDPMFQWESLARVAQHVTAFRDSPLAVQVEDPFPQDRPDEWRRWRDATGRPLVWHARTHASLCVGFAAGCADAYNCGGCVAEFLTSAHACEAVGTPCWHGSAIELGVAQVAQLHAAAAARACTLPSDIVSPLVREHTLIDWDWPYDRGLLPLPTGPGLGVSLDRDALAHYTIHRATFS